MQPIRAPFGSAHDQNLRADALILGLHSGATWRGKGFGLRSSACGWRDTPHPRGYTGTILGEYRSSLKEHLQYKKEESAIKNFEVHETAVRTFHLFIDQTCHSFWDPHASRLLRKHASHVVRHQQSCAAMLAVY
jgi:hypothetical protein